MTWIQITTSIYQTLDTNGLNHISKEIQDEQLTGGTPGEMFIVVVAKLVSIKDRQPQVYALIKEETEWMIAYAKTFGYLQ